ncbi:hypothetical protein KC342_g16696 [Hortaea werneckii]|nr:hypothetical protein KC342_g16696 [Hortaea werneckii]
MPKRTGTPSRLGVLPSPTANTHAQAEEEVAKGKGGHGPSASIDAKAVEPVADGGVAVGGEDGDLSGSKLAQRESGLRDDDDAFQVETDMKAGEGDAPVLSTSQAVSTETPQQDRRGSALATLPSQQRAAGSSCPASPATPFGPSLRQQVAENETYPVETGMADPEPSQGADLQSSRSAHDDPGTTSRSENPAGDVPLGTTHHMGELQEPRVQPSD